MLAMWRLGKPRLINAISYRSSQADDDAQALVFHGVTSNVHDLRRLSKTSNSLHPIGPRFFFRPTSPGPSTIISPPAFGGCHPDSTAYPIWNSRSSMDPATTNLTLGSRNRGFPPPFVRFSFSGRKVSSFRIMIPLWRFNLRAPYV